MDYVFLICSQIHFTDRPTYITIVLIIYDQIRYIIYTRKHLFRSITKPLCSRALISRPI